MTMMKKSIILLQNGLILLLTILTLSRRSKNHLYDAAQNKDFYLCIHKRLTLTQDLLVRIIIVRVFCYKIVLQMTKKLAKCFGGIVTWSKICPTKKIRNSNYLFFPRTKCISLCLVSLFLVSNERQTYLKKKSQIKIVIQ